MHTVYFGNVAGGKPRIVMKLDIEGAEYRVVPHLLQQDAMCALDPIFLEKYFRTFLEDWFS